MVSSTDKPDATEALPFVAPCKQLDTFAALRWLRLGWQDLARAPRQSLTYGGVIVLLSWLVSALAYRFGDLAMLLSLASGFIFLGPILAIGMYSVSCQIQKGLKPKLGYCLREGRRHMSNELVFAVMLMIVFLIWARAASMVHVFFPPEEHPTLQEQLVYFGIGTAVGSVFAGIVFAASAFSLPMIMDRKVDMVTAVVTSVNAVLRNKGAMAVWAALIVAAVGIGFATAFVGLAVLLPLIGHATWHAYQETIDAHQWPVHGDLASAR
jgi:uncharacterized membrane protein